jgi:hypothetical protein
MRWRLSCEPRCTSWASMRAGAGRPTGLRLCWGEWVESTVWRTRIGPEFSVCFANVLVAVARQIVVSPTRHA